MGFIRVGSRFGEFFFEVFIDCFVWSGGGRNGQDPVLCTSFPFVDIQAIHIGEGVGDFLPRFHHNWLGGVHKLVKVEFVEESVGLLSVSVKNRGFSSLEGFFVSSNWVRVLWESWWRSWRWCWRRWSSIRFLSGFRVWCCRSKLVSCQERPCKFATCRRYHFGRCHGLHLFSGGNGSDLDSGLVIRSFQVVVDVGDSFQSSFDVVNWAGFS